MQSERNPKIELRSCPGCRPPSMLAWLVAGLAALFFAATSGVVSAQELQSVRAVQPGEGQAQLFLRFSGPPPEPSIFKMDSPPRIAVDLAGVTNRLAERTTEIDIGPLLSVTAVEAGNRTRVILNLAASAEYQSRVDGNQLILDLGTGVADVQPIAPALELQSVRAARVGAGQTQLSLRFSGPPPEASIFAIDAPPRLAVDLPGVASRLAERTTEINVGPLLSATAVEAGGRTRVVLNLANRTDYRSRVDGNHLIVDVGTGVADVQPLAAAPTPVAPVQPGVRSTQPPAINDIDFRRGIDGQGRVLVDLSRPGVTVDVREQAGRVEVTFPRVLMDERFERRMNVVDFATPVTSIDIMRDGDERVRMIVNATGQYDVLAYQTDRTYVLELAPLSEEELEAQRLEREEYVGERLSLNFQDIEVRSVLQLLADFTDLNIVVSDSVRGNITLRLNNVPWDQALDIILTTRGLDKRVRGNVMYVAPAEEIAARERRDLEAQRDRRELEPLRTEFITVNFNQANNIERLLQTRRVTDRDRAVTFLSDRSSVAVDPRTNTLIIRDTQEQIEAIRRLVTTLDVPTRQVLIETRVVIADDNYRRELGARFGVSGGERQGRSNLGLSGTLEGASGISSGLATGTPGIPPLGQRLNTALPAGGGGSIGFSVLRPNILLDLELSALQSEGRGEIISSPRVITANGQTATIKQGAEIPFRTLDAEGAPVTEWKDAFLETAVTPQITPNGNVIMDIKVSKNEPVQIFGDTSISVREVETQVAVANGETVVLGGVYEISSSTNLEMVPFLGEVPFLKHFFRRNTNTNTKAELLIFVTPRVLD